jgi:hypothetical protein
MRNMEGDHSEDAYERRGGIKKEKVVKRIKRGEDDEEDMKGKEGENKYERRDCEEEHERKTMKSYLKARGVIRKDR